MSPPSRDALPRPGRHDTRALDVLADVGRHPIRHAITNWNWKSSVTSAVIRGGIFFVANAPAGLGWATRAMLTEMVYRTAASGVLGSLTQALRHSRPRAVPLILLPALGHLAEYVVHRAAGTPRLSTSILASVAFSVLTTAFTMFAMRRGVLVVGEGQQSLWADLRRMPSLIVAFVVSPVGAVRVASAFPPSPRLRRTRRSFQRRLGRRKAAAVEQEFGRFTHPSG